MNTVDSEIDGTKLVIETNGDSFIVTGYMNTISSRVTLNAKEMEEINNLFLYQGRSFPNTLLQKVFVTMLVGGPSEQWWNFLTGFGEVFVVKVTCEDFKTVWESMRS